MRTTHMGHPRSPNSRGAQPASVNAGANLTSFRLWELLVDPTAENIFRWFCIPADAREAIACAFVEMFGELREDCDIELTLEVTVLLLDLASGLPPCELTDIATALEPALERLTLSNNVRVISSLIEDGLWALPEHTTTTPAALHASP